MFPGFFLTKITQKCNKKVINNKITLLEQQIYPSPENISQPLVVMVLTFSMSDQAISRIYMSNQ